MGGAGTRPVRQERSRVTQRKVLDAARAALIESGRQGLAISNVAAAAGVSVGSIYQRFGDKRGLIEALQHDVLDSVDDDLRDGFARLTADSPSAAPQLLAAAIELLSIQVEQHGAAMGQLLLHAVIDPTLQDRGQATSVLAEDLFVGLLRTHAEVFDPPPSDTSVRVAFRSVFGSAMWTLMFGASADGALIEHKVLVHEWTQMTQRYLIGPD